MTNESLVHAGQQGRRLLTEIETKQILENAGIRTTAARLATSAEEAAGLAAAIGFPVVLKIASSDIVHKSDSGGVTLDLRDEDAVRAAYQQIRAAVQAAEPGARIDGVAVQPMARPGVEVIVGVSRDPQFGSLLMFGLGGVLVELLEDVSFRLIPITPRDARQMLGEIRAHALLEGYRGREPVSLDAIEQLLLSVSKLIDEHPEIAELDLNPVIAYRDGVVAVDARAVVEAVGAGSA
jgi:acyl-CoA synthetase (NDP forming)